MRHARPKNRKFLDVPRMGASVPFWYDLGQFLWIPTTIGFLGPPWLKGSANSHKGSDSGFAAKLAS